LEVNIPMKSLIILFFIISIPFLSFSQREENELKGTTVLFGSDKNQHARWEDGFWLAEIKASPCQGENEHMAKPKINSIQHLGDTTVLIDATINENCCHSFLGEIEILEDSILHLTYINYGPFCACYCCFGLTYQIDIFPDEEEYNYSRIKYVMVDGRRETLTRLKLGK
jgi:hypothetical protein